MQEHEMDSQIYIKERLEDQIQWYNSKSMWNQKWFKSLKVVQLVTASLIPMLIAYVTQTTILLKIASGLLGVVVAIVTGIISLFRFQENWIEYRNMAESLKNEKYLFLSGVQPYDSEDAYKNFVHKVESLISAENVHWSHYVGTQKENTKGK